MKPVIETRPNKVLFAVCQRSCRRHCRHGSDYMRDGISDTVFPPEHSTPVIQSGGSMLVKFWLCLSYFDKNTGQKM